MRERNRSTGWMTAGMTGLLLAAAMGLLLSGLSEDAGLRRAADAASRHAAGQTITVSSETLTAMCEWMPASSTGESSFAVNSEMILASNSASRMAARRQEGSGPVSGAELSEEADMVPVRIIRDTYPTYSAIAVDYQTDEVYMQDENLFGYRVFGRLDNTPAQAAFTEPRRIVQGLSTGLEFNCGLYIDPKTGDVYSVNNDTQDTMVIFAREAEGNVPPKRKLSTPHGTFGIAVDEVEEELYLTVEHQNSVVVFEKYAEGDTPFHRELRGEKTMLADPHGITIDVRNQRMYVGNHGNRTFREPGRGEFLPPSILVFPLKAEGNIAPLQTIAGDKTELNWPAAMAIDEEAGEIYVANDAGDSLLVFKTTDNGNVAPTRKITGSRTQIKNPTGVVVDKKNNEVWLSNMGNHRATVFPLKATGNVAPKRVIRSAPNDKLAMAIGNPGAVGFDTKREEVLIPN